MSDDLHPGKTVVKVFDVFLHGFELCRSTGIFRSPSVAGHPTGVDYMAADTVIARSPIGHFPRVHVCVLVILHQTLYGPVKLEQVRISDLFPATPALPGRVRVPRLDVSGCDLTSLGRGCTVDNQIFHPAHGLAWLSDTVTVLEGVSFREITRLPVLTVEPELAWAVTDTVFP